jgi:hypothetical protein
MSDAPIKTLWDNDRAMREIESLRQQLAEKESKRQELMRAFERQGNSAQEVITELRQQLAAALAIQPDDAALKDKAMTTYEQPKDWIERHLVEDPGGLLACEPSGLNEELKLARQANEFQHQTIKKQAAQIATMRELLLLSKNGCNAAYQESVQKALAATADLDGLILCHAEPCRDDGRCQYAIDHGAEGLGHCPEGKCCMPLYRAWEPTK